MQERITATFYLVLGYSVKNLVFTQNLSEIFIQLVFSQCLKELKFPQSSWERYTLTNLATIINQNTGTN